MIMKRALLSTRRAGFTLIEVLTVVAIVAMLAAMGFAGLRYAMNKSREKDCVALIASIGKSIGEYKDDNGNYPRPASDDEQTSIDGETYKISGARTLYQVLSGDGTDAIKGGEKPSTGEPGSAQDDKDPSLGKIYMDTVVAPTKKQVEEKKKLKLVDAAGDTTFFVIDPWRHPFQYQLPEYDKNGLKTTSMETYSDANYELWSFGPLKKPETTEEAQKEWITNWTAK
jgi:prepilin-type N-terminal cleavage/methylation domain-containing protein